MPSTAPVISTTTIVSSIAIGVGGDAGGLDLPGVAGLDHARRWPPCGEWRSTPRTGPWSASPSARLVTLAGLASLYLGLFTGVGNRLTLVGVGALLVFVGVALLGPTFAAPGQPL